MVQTFYSPARGSGNVSGVLLVSYQERSSHEYCYQANVRCVTSRLPTLNVSRALFQAAVFWLSRSAHRML